MDMRWDTTVTELLGLLRQALAALVPVAEKARIPWRDGEAYDDWDAIAGSLYDNIVVRSLAYASGVGQGVVLPKYDLVYPSYRDSFILVEGKGIPQEVLAAFVGFAGISPDFAGVRWVKVLPSGEVPDQTIEYAPYDACQFFLVRRRDNERKKIHAVTIEI